MPDDIHGEFIINSGGTNPAGTSAESTIPVKKSRAHFYSSLSFNPENVKFENQEADEQIILLIRRHLITNVPWIVTALIFIITPLVLSFFSNLFTPFFHISSNTLFVLVLFYYLIILGFILVEFSLWYFTVGIVTNKRLIDLDLIGILNKHVSETKLNLIEDVSYVQVGSIRSVFNYGDVEIQTAGTLTNFEFDRAPEPARIVRIIADLIGRRH